MGILQDDRAFYVPLLSYIRHAKFDVLSHWDLGIDLSPQYNLAVSNENEDDFTWTNLEGMGGVRIYYTLV